ncbi:MAG TPA: ABC transporter ATP-binding protein, partial [Ruminococcus flavefaciens]|nr:ABC transporter ATP-binding protein [Ruminococcus flavefaciens]
RQLQRKGIPFAVGVLHENDIEFPAAKALASVLIAESAFEPVSVEKVSDAMTVMEKCSYVLCSNHKFGTMNKENAKLLEKAENCGKLIKDVEDIG